MRERPDLKAVSDDRLLHGLFEILKRTRHDEVDLVAHIAEVDARKLYAREATSSMFAWCTEVLHLSEAEAYLRIAAARASRRHPVLLAMLADGRLHLSGIERLAPHLTERNRDELLERAVHKSKRQIEQLLAELAPRPAAPATMRKLPTRRGPEAHRGGRPGPDGVAAVDGVPSADGVVSAAPELRPDGVFEAGSGPNGGACSTGELRPDGVAGASMSGSRPSRTVEAIAPDRFRLQFDLGAELRDKLERLQALMRSSVPDGDLAKIIDVAVTRELERLEARRFAKTKKPRKTLAQTDTRPKSSSFSTVVGPSPRAPTPPLRAFSSRCRSKAALGSRLEDRACARGR